MILIFARQLFRMPHHFFHPKYSFRCKRLFSTLVPGVLFLLINKDAGTQTAIAVNYSGFDFIVTFNLIAQTGVRQ